jgi:hypothetical protein
VRARRAETRLPSRQPGQIIFTSGEPKTHPVIERCVRPEQPRLPVEFVETYVCSGGVNVVPLLMATRATLLVRAEAALGADTLTDEQYVAPVIHLGFVNSRFLLIGGNVSSQVSNTSQMESTKSKCATFSFSYWIRS